MSPVYQAHPGPNLLAWADKTTPRTGEMKLHGITSAVDIEKDLDNLARSRALFPIELQAAKIKADLMEIELERSSILNSQEMLSLTAAMQKQDMENKLIGMRDIMRDREVIKDYDMRAAATLPALIQAGDTDGIAQFYQNETARLGDDYYRTADSKWSWARVREGLRDDKKAELDTALFTRNAEREIQKDQISKLIQKTNAELVDIDIELQRKKKAAELTKIPLGELGVGGDKRSRPDKRDKAMAYFFASLYERMEADPLAETERVEMGLYKRLAERYGADSLKRGYGRVRRLLMRGSPISMLSTNPVFKEFREYHPKLASMLGVKDFDPFGVGDPSWYWDDVNQIVNNINDITNRIDSKDPKIRKTAEVELEKYLNAFRKYTPTAEIRIEAEERLRKLVEAQQRIGAFQTRFAEPEPPTRRYESRRIIERRGGATRATGLPNFATETEARQAGYKTGDRIMINGVSGTLQ